MRYKVSISFSRPKGEIKLLKLGIYEGNTHGQAITKARIEYPEFKDFVFRCAIMKQKPNIYATTK